MESRVLSTKRAGEASHHSRKRTSEELCRGNENDEGGWNRRKGSAEIEKREKSAREEKHSRSAKSLNFAQRQCVEKQRHEGKCPDDFKRKNSMIDLRRPSSSHGETSEKQRQFLVEEVAKPKWPLGTQTQGMDGGGDLTGHFRLNHKCTCTSFSYLQQQLTSLARQARVQNGAQHHPDW